MIVSTHMASFGDGVVVEVLGLEFFMFRCTYGPLSAAVHLTGNLFDAIWDVERGWTLMNAICFY